MPWRKIEPMEERMEFCLKALRSGNFRQLCREKGISARIGHSAGQSVWPNHLAQRSPLCQRQLSRMVTAPNQSYLLSAICHFIRASGENDVLSQFLVRGQSSSTSQRQRSMYTRSAALLSRTPGRNLCTLWLSHFTN